MRASNCSRGSLDEKDLAKKDPLKRFSVEQIVWQTINHWLAGCRINLPANGRRTQSRHAISASEKLFSVPQMKSAKGTVNKYYTCIL